MLALSGGGASPVVEEVLAAGLLAGAFVGAVFGCLEQHERDDR